MPNIETGPRVVVSVTATGGGDWQVVSTPTGFNGITSALFADNDYIHGFCRFENGVDWEEYDTDSDSVTGLLQIANVSGTVTITRPATPYASSNGGARVAVVTGTHTLAISLGSGTMKRILREINGTWRTFTSGDATPTVADYRLFKTAGSTTITAFDNMEDGKLFIVQRGAADITIADGAGISLPGNQNLTLTASLPGAIFVEDGGVAILVSTVGPMDWDQVPNTIAATELTIASGAITPIYATHTVDTEADAASDDLVTITGTNFKAGDSLTLSAANGSRDVVIKASGGNILLPNDLDITLDDVEKTVILRFDGTNWNYVAGASSVSPIIPNSIVATTLTIATGAIVPTRSTHIVAAESGTSDDLATVTTTNFKAGDTIKISPDTGDTITIKASGGNITTDTGTDIVLDAVTKYAWLHVTASGVVASASGVGQWSVDRLDEVLLTAGGTTFTISASGLTITFSSGNPLAEHMLITVAGTSTASDGRVMIVTALSGTSATLAAWQGGPVFVDGGPYSTGQTVSHVRRRLYSTIFDEDDDNFPKFRISDYFSRNKIEAFSLILTDPGDTPELGMRIASGDKKTPSIRSAPWPGAYIYATAWDGTSFDGTYPHSKRNAQIAFPIVTGPTTTDHSGAIVFQTTREGSITPIDRLGVVSDGGTWVWGGGTAEDNPSFDTVAEIDAHTETAADRVNAPSGYHSWLLDKVSPARLNIPAPRDATKMAQCFYEVASSAADGFGFNLEYGDTQFQFMARNSSVNQQLGRVNYANGAWDLGFAVNGSTNYGFRIQPVNSAVNAWEFSPSVTGSKLLALATGTDANVGFDFQTKGTGPFYITNSDAGNVGAQLFLYHNSASPAVGDRVGDIFFRGKDSGGTDTPAYAQISGITTNVTNGGTEAGKLEFYTRTADNGTLKMTIENGVYLGAPTGSDKGLGWLNAAAGLAVNGVQWTSGTGSPESVVTALQGSLYSRTDGGNDTTLYVKESGSGNTGWVAVHMVP